MWECGLRRGKREKEFEIVTGTLAWDLGKDQRTPSVVGNAGRSRAKVRERGGTVVRR